MQRNVFIFNSVILSLLCLRKVIADTCQFYRGSTSITQTCSSGCCDNACCTEDYKTLAIILGVVFGCLLFIVVVTIIVVCLTRNRWSKKIAPHKDRKKTGQNGNNIELGKMTKVSN